MKPSELIADPAKWTKGAYARDAKGAKLADNCDPIAVCWCAAGAIERCYPKPTDDRSYSALYSRLLDHIDSAHVSIWNDAPERTHDEVVSALKACGL